jgi:hypothetical protein
MNLDFFRVSGNKCHKRPHPDREHNISSSHQIPFTRNLVRSVDLANSAETIARVELVLARADHEPRVTLALVGAVEVGHGLLEEGRGLVLGRGAGVKTELGDPDWLAVLVGGLLDVGLEAVDGAVVVDVVEVDVGGLDDGVGADLVEVGQPSETHGRRAVCHLLDVN